MGTLVAAYLTWLHYSGSLAFCIGVGGCEAVQTSRWSMIGDIPVALIGFAGFAVILAVAVARLRVDDPRLDLALFALSLAATGYVAYLTYIELFVLGAVCPWCVSVAVCAIIVLGLAVADLLESPGP